MSLTAASPELTSAAEPSASWKLPRTIPELDGIRGLAILLVLLCHTGGFFGWEQLRTVLSYGSVGVDLFFVLSGFLITGILLDSRDDPNRARNFYVRRGLRIWPLYFTYLTVAAVAFRWMMPASPRLWTYALFIQNFLFVDGTGPILQPMWSLALEEQFYIVWPSLAFRLRRETVLRVCCAIVLVSPLIRIAYFYFGALDSYVYANTVTRLDGIALGSAMAALVRDPRFVRDRMKRLTLHTLAGCGAASTIVFGFAPHATITLSLSYSLIALTCGSILALALCTQGEENLYVRFFRQNWLMFLGKVSFALYLFNYPIYTLVHGNHGKRLMTQLGLSGWTAELTLTIAGNALVIAAAWVSWHTLESRMLKLKSRLAPR